MQEQQMKLNTIASLVQGIIALGHDGAMAAAECQSADTYEFGMDQTADMKLLPGILNMVYKNVVGAALRGSEHEKAIPELVHEVDQDTDPVLSNGPEREKSKLLTLEEALFFASAVYDKCLSYANYEGGSWLVSMTKSEFVKVDTDDGKTMVVREYTTTKIIKSFDEYLVDQIAVGGDWGLACLYVRQLGTTVSPFKGGIDAATEVFFDYLNEEIEIAEVIKTRLQMRVEQTANNKWKAFATACMARDEKASVKALTDWNLLVFSPVMASTLARIKNDPIFILHQAEQEMEKQERVMLKQEVQVSLLEMKTKLNARQADLDARMKALDARMPKKAEEPKVLKTETLVEAPKGNGAAGVNVFGPGNPAPIQPRQ